MKLSFEYNSQKIAYTIRYKKTHAILIQVEQNEEVIVTAPIGASVFSIMDKVKGHASWILNEIKKNKNKQNVPQQYMYLGKNYGLEFQVNDQQDDIKVKLIRGKFIVEGKYKDDVAIKKALYEWYKQKTIAKAKERIKIYKEYFETTPKKVQVEILKGKLSQIEKNEIILDINSGVLPLHVLDYVIVHSLCKYNSIVDISEKIETVLPQYMESSNWINSNQDKFLFS